MSQTTRWFWATGGRGSCAAASRGRRPRRARSRARAAAGRGRAGPAAVAAMSRPSASAAPRRARRVPVLVLRRGVCEQPGRQAIVAWGKVDRELVLGALVELGGPSGARTGSAGPPRVGDGQQPLLGEAVEVVRGERAPDASAVTSSRPTGAPGRRRSRTRCGGSDRRARSARRQARAGRSCRQSIDKID